MQCIYKKDVFMLDLDVGFLTNPNTLLQVYRESPLVDIFVQEDFIYIMNRTLAGWKTWYSGFPYIFIHKLELFIIYI